MKEEWTMSEEWRCEYGQGEGDVNGLRGGAAGLGSVQREEMYAV